jgi:aspartate aminotransferase
MGPDVTSIANAARVSDRVRRIKPSPSSAAADRANELRRQGKSIVNLVVGEPDFDTPPHIRQAAAAAIEQGATRYTALVGTLELRQAIAAKLARENRLTYSPSEIIVTNGAKSAIYAALAATLQAGAEVVIPAPYWVSYPDMVLACDGVPVTVACTEQQGFKLTAAQLSAAITPKTRWVLLNSPSNPTGATYSVEDYRALAATLTKHPHVMVMTDDIYEHIHFMGGIAPHLLTAAPELRDRTLAVNGVSKTYAMTGWRIGWIAGPRDLIRAVDILLSQAAGNACSISQAAAVAALNGDQSLLKDRCATYKQRRDIMAQRLNGIDGLTCALPDGAFYLYVNCAGLISKTTPAGKVLESDSDVVMYFLELAGVAVVAGSAYGLAPYFRLSIAASLDVLREGADRIAKAVADLR